MKFLNRYFFAGVFVGIVLTIGGIVAISVGYLSMMKGKMGETLPPGTASALHESDPITTLRQGDDWHLRDLEGRPMTLSEHRGRVVFLNKWATWCGPCRAEMPSIAALYDSLREEGVVFALVSDEPAAKVDRFVKGYAIHVPVYVCEGKPPQAYQSMGIPATFILDRSGNVVAEHFGAANWDTPGCRSYLRRLLSR